MKTMKTKNQKRFALWVVVAVAMIVSAALSLNYVVFCACIVPVGMACVYGVRMDMENEKSNNRIH